MKDIRPTICNFKLTLKKPTPFSDKWHSLTCRGLLSQLSHSKVVDENPSFLSSWPLFRAGLQRPQPPKPLTFRRPKRLTNKQSIETKFQNIKRKLGFNTLSLKAILWSLHVPSMHRGQLLSYIMNLFCSFWPRCFNYALLGMSYLLLLLFFGSIFEFHEKRGFDGTTVTMSFSETRVKTK